VAYSSESGGVPHLHRCRLSIATGMLELVVSVHHSESKSDEVVTCAHHMV